MVVVLNRFAEREQNPLGVEADRRVTNHPLGEGQKRFDAVVLGEPDLQSRASLKAPGVDLPGLKEGRRIVMVRAVLAPRDIENRLGKLGEDRRAVTGLFPIGVRRAGQKRGGAQNRKNHSGQTRRNPVGRHQSKASSLQMLRRSRDRTDPKHTFLPLPLYQNNK